MRKPPMRQPTAAPAMSPAVKPWPLCCNEPALLDAEAPAALADEVGDVAVVGFEPIDNLPTEVLVELVGVEVGGEEELCPPDWPLLGRRMEVTVVEKAPLAMLEVCVS